jgi:hypothetical protein
MAKTFQGHFDMILDKLKSGVPFGYARYSDGELRIMQNLETQIGSNFHVIGDKRGGGNYHDEDHKHFDPKIHQFHHTKLMEAFRFKKDNYYVGLSCRCCVGEKDFKQMCDWYEGDVESDNLTWSNLLLNGNYPQFVNKFIPEFKKKKIVYIVNEHSDLNGLPFEVVKDFRVGKNCIINNYDMIEDIKKWIDENDIEDHVFLFSASSLSNFMVHQLFDYNDKNTYIDVGTTLNPYMGMKGRRGYHGGNKKMCIW